MSRLSSGASGTYISSISIPAPKTALPGFNDGKCRCLYPGCGALLDILTHVHAESHGYPNKEAMIKDGMVKTLSRRLKK